MERDIEKVPDNISETHPTVVVCVPRLFEKMYTKIIEGLKTAPSIRQKIFWWAIKVGRNYSLHSINGEKIPLKNVDDSPSHN